MKTSRLRRRHARPSAGMTLIELMVAVAVFAVLGVLSWQGLSRIADGQARIEAELARWRAIDRALHRIESRLLQAAAYETPAAGRRQAVLRHDPSDPTAELGFQALAAAGTRREAFLLVDGMLQWRRWPMRETGGTPEADHLLEDVTGLGWRFFSEHKSTLTWPPADAPAHRLPAAVEIELELADAGRIARVFALR
ncbi:type II secretion system protein GspJ [Thauera phenolivorans]|uniref:type II secretion system protein GspJ n=1 Tax=Thauera phenolivorans TaxID=1792543 RepID=UPI00083AB1E6|nr:type II secretion system protein GspJ [Thauera phenolivorans]